MRGRPIEHYIVCGMSVRYLQDIGPGAQLHGDAYVLSNIDALKVHLDAYELQVTARAAANLFAFAETLRGAPQEHRLDATQAAELSRMIAELTPTLRAEASGKFAYFVTDKHIDVNKLLDDMPSLFAPNVFNALPDIAKQDFISAGRAIAFELPTAAAFHTLRATEAVLREYYCSVVKRKSERCGDPLMRGPMLKHLVSLSGKRSQPTALTNQLDHIRLSFRNPTQHPDATYDIHEAQDLFNICLDAVNRMTRSRP
jgi:hypothetical protein